MNKKGGEAVGETRSKANFCSAFTCSQRHVGSMLDEDRNRLGAATMHGSGRVRYLSGHLYRRAQGRATIQRRPRGRLDQSRQRACRLYHRVLRSIPHPPGTPIITHPHSIYEFPRSQGRARRAPRTGSVCVRSKQSAELPTAQPPRVLSQEPPRRGYPAPPRPRDTRRIV